MIGVQSHILAVASPEKKTQGAAIIVFGFQGGMISGMALGSLLVNFTCMRRACSRSPARSALAALIYTLAMIPRVAGEEQVEGRDWRGRARLVSDIKKVVTSLEFLKILFCIGVPAKAILTGIITFAMPLLLVQYGYRPEDIGQIIMLYGLGVMAATGYVSRLVDRTKQQRSGPVLGRRHERRRPGA